MKVLKIDYKNYRDKTSLRTIVPVRIWYGSTEFHTEEQYLLEAYDIDKLDYRNFALKDIIKFY